MKIIQLIYSLSSGGAERFIVNLSNQLAYMGHDVTICMFLSDMKPEFVFNKQFAVKNVKVHSMRFSSGFSWKKMRIIEQYIYTENPDIVHCHLNVIPYIFRMALNHRNKIRFIHTIHSVADNASGKKWQRTINRYYYAKRLITPVTISDKCRLSYEEYYDLPSPICIYNGCEVPLKTASFEKVKNEVSSYKTNSTTPVFIHVARYHEQKNQILLINAFNRLYTEGIDFVLLVIGGGFNQGNALRLQSCNKIHFLGLKNNVADYLLCSDAFCLTSIYEGLPISLLEAMACGVVPICTKVGGVPDVIKNGETGILSEVDEDEYIHAIKQYLSNKISKERLIECFNMNYSIKKCAEQYIYCYNQ